MQLWEFFTAVGSHFKPLAAAVGFLVLHAFIYFRREAGKPVNIPDWIVKLGIISGVLLACFLAWNDQKTAREGAEVDSKYKQVRIDRLIDLSKAKALDSSTSSFVVKSEHQSGGIGDASI